jgi:predicted nucleic acid-binding protein
VKVIADANIWISFLLARGKDTTITRAVEQAMSWPFQLIMPQETITEIANSVHEFSLTTKRWKSIS